MITRAVDASAEAPRQAAADGAVALARAAAAAVRRRADPARGLSRTHPAAEVVGADHLSPARAAPRRVPVARAVARPRAALRPVGAHAAGLAVALHRAWGARPFAAAAPDREPGAPAAVGAADAADRLAAAPAAALRA